MNYKRFLLLICFGVFAMPIILNAKTVYVKSSASGGNTGTSWANAYTDLQNGIGNAIAGDQVWVAKGTYKPTSGTDRAISFQMKTGVSIYGGFNGSETSLEQRDWNANETILSGNIGSLAVDTDNSYHVVVGASNAIADGLVIEKGYADGVGWLRAGAGLYGIGNNLSVKNCLFRNNYCASDGGGIEVTPASSMTIESCKFISNSTVNAASGGGGGIHIQQSTAVIKSCVFYQNNAGNGGGVCSYMSTSPVSITNSIFISNSSSGSGGGIYADSSTVNVNNCVLYGNTKVYFGGAVCHVKTGSIALKNCIVWGNTSTPIQTAFSGTATASYCDIQGGYAGIGNINTDPVFADTAASDFHLKSKGGRWNGASWTYDAQSSPCIDAGDPASAYLNETAPNGSRINMGAYGNTAYASRTYVPMTVTFIAGTNGTLTGMAIQTVAQGGNCSAITAVPNPGYRFLSWTGDYSGTANPITISDVVLNMTITANFVANDVIPGLVAYYPFNGNANDESGYGNNGTVNGATLTADRFGNANSAYSFDGNSNNIQAANQTQLNFESTQDFTISAWVLCNSMQANKWIVVKYNDSFIPSYGLGTGFVGGSYSFIRDALTPSPTDCIETRGTKNLVDGRWHQLIMNVKRDDKIRVYVDGVFEVESTSLGNVAGALENALPLTIGSNSTRTKNFTGKIDDIRIYKRAISEEEIVQLYQSESQGLVAYYPFNGNANDESGNGNNGTVNGATLTADRFGNANSAYSFDGNSTYISTNYEGILGSSPRTISIWAKTTYVPPNQPNVNGVTLLGYGTKAGGKYFSCDFNGNFGMLKGISIDTNDSYIMYEGNNNDGVWHHYVWVLPSLSTPKTSDVKIYMDSQLLNTINSSCNYNPNTLINTIKTDLVKIGIRYFGELDDISIYNRALSALEITDLYAKEKAYTATFTAGAGGTLTGQATQTIPINGSCSQVAAVPNTGYHFVNWTGDYTGTENPLTLTNITANKTVTANFSLDTNNVQITTNLRSLNINEGSTNSFQVKLTVQPAASKTVSVARLSGDSNISVTSGDSLTFTTVNWNTYQPVTLAAAQDADIANGSAVIRCSSSGMADKDVTASVVDNDYTLTVSNDGNGTTIPSGALIRTKGTAASVFAINGTGYHFSNWTVAGGTAIFADANSEGTTVTASADATVRANFSINTYTVTFDLAGKGTSAGGGTLAQTINYGGSAVAPTVTANAGWAFTGWDKTFNNITAGTTVTAQYSVLAPTCGWVKGAGSATYASSGYGIVTDSLGNPYAAGAFWGTMNFGNGINLTSSGSNDGFTVKYDKDGNCVWAGEEKKSTGHDAAMALTIDSSSNLYITGSGDNPLMETFLKKSDLSGISSPLINVTSRNGNNEGRGVAVDSSGNIYIVGIYSGGADFMNGNTILTGSGYYNIFLVKYNSSGTSQWIKGIGTDTANDFGCGIAIDSSGNIYITGAYQGTCDFGSGQSVTSAGGMDAFIAKYDVDGNCSWVKSAGDTGEDSGNGIKTDASGNIYITGSFSGSADFGGGKNVTSAGGTDIFIAKYASDGNCIQVNKAGSAGDDVGYSIVIDSAGYTYVTGSFSNTADFGEGQTFISAGGTDIFVAKYDLDGNCLWAERAGSTGNDVGTGITLDPEGAIYVTGKVSGAADFGNGRSLSCIGTTDFFMARYNQKECAVSFIAGTYGSITGTIVQPVNHGADCSEVTAVPDAGCRFVNWTGDYTGTANPLTVTNVISNMTITANFDNGSVIYVKSNASGANNGTSWTNAYNNLYDALNCSISGNEIWVAAGTYKPTSGTDRAISFQLKSNVSLYGGFRGDETFLGQRDWNANVVVLSGDIGIQGERNDNSYRVITAIGTTGVVLDGLKIQDGNANNSSYPHGAGLNASGASINVRNCIFYNNSSPWTSGNGRGGAANFSTGPSVIESCTMYNNSATEGAAIFGRGDLTLKNSLIYNNNALTNGGGFYCRGETSNIINCVFYGNSAGHNGTAVYTWDGAAILKDSIVWNQGGTRIFTIGGSVSATYCDIQGGYAGTGNINSDPLFVNAAGNDFHLKSAAGHWTSSGWVVDAQTSPCVDAGAPTSAFSNEPDPNGNRINMGAYGNTSQASKSLLVITFVEGVNGTITGTKLQSVVSGSDCSAVMAVPNTGYHFTNWTGDYSGTTNPLTISNVTANRTVTANFAVNDVQITTDLTFLNINEGSTNSFRAKLTMQPPASKTVTVAKVSGDGDITVSSGASLIFTTSNWDTYQTVTLAAAQDADTANGSAVIRCSSSGMADKDVTASVADNDYTLTVSNDGNGTTIPSGALIRTKGIAASVFAISGTGYHFSNWTVAGGTAIFADANSEGTTVTASADATVRANFAINTYTVTFDLAGKGTSAGGGTLAQTINYGGSAATPTVTANPGWTFKGWDKTFNNITGNTTVTALYAATTYTVTFVEGMNGTITGTKSQTVNHGAAGSEVTAVPNTGYHFVNWTGSLASTSNPLTVTNVTVNMTITANFEINDIVSGLVAYYPFDGNANDATGNGNNGTVIGSTLSEDRLGRAGKAYYFDGISDYITIPYSEDFNIAPTGAFTISVWVKPVSLISYHGIFVKGGELWDYGLLIMPNQKFMTGLNDYSELYSTSAYKENEWQMVTAVYNNGDWKMYLDGILDSHKENGALIKQSSNGIVIGAKTVGPAFLYRGTIDELRIYNKELSAGEILFLYQNSSSPGHTVTFVEGANGTISGNKTQLVDHGSICSSEVTAVPNTGYHFVNWTGSLASTSNPLTVTNVTVNMTITANFEINHYTRTYSAGANGSVTGTTPQTINYGSNGTLVTAVPNTGYHFIGWSDGVSTASRTEMNVTANGTVTASFAINTYTLSYIAGTNGSITGTTFQTVNHGANGTAVTAVANNGYRFTLWSDGMVIASRTDTNITANKTVTASFTSDAISPSFTLHPSGTSVTAWQTASFTATATGTPTPSYQWQVSTNGGGSWSNVTTGTGGTSSSYTTPITVSGDNGRQFRCVATNSVNSATSNAATLTVTAATSVRTISGTSVSIAVMPPSGTSAWGVEETIPAGLTPSAISGSNGNWNSTTRKITWYATGAATATLGYSVSGSDGSYTVAGMDSFDGANSTVGGPAAIVILAYHPADTNRNSIMVMSEAIAYLAGWQQGNNPMNYAIRAAYLWQNGESYTRQIGLDEPLCWIPSGSSGPVLIARMRSPDLAMDAVTQDAVRSIAGNAVTITVTPPTGNSAWGYEELVPEGLTPADIMGPNGNWNTTSRKITWYATGATAASLGYTVSGNDGTYTVSGSVSFDGTDTPATGDSQIVLGIYTVTFDLGDKGKITGGGALSQTINHGSAATPPTVTANVGWTFTGWDKTFNNITGNTTVTALYAVATYNVTFVEGANGTITGTKSQIVNHGAGCTAVTAVPATNYHFVDWTGDYSGTTNPLTISNVTANKTITATFAINTYTVTFDLEDKGARTGGGDLSQTINHGGAATAPTVTANAGWTFNGWNNTFGNITSSQAVKAKWIVGPPVINDPGMQKTMVGVPFTLLLAVASESSPVSSVTVAGLPTGLKFDAKTMKITGVPTTATSKTVTVTAKNDFKTPAVLTFSMTVDLLPVWAYGTFNGSCVVDNDSGAATMTVTALGKVTGKLSAGGVNYAFSSASYARRDEDGAFWISTDISVNKSDVPLTFKVTNPAGVVPATLSVAEGWLADEAIGEPAVKMYRNVWKDAGVAVILDPYIGYYTAVLPGGAAFGSGYLAITVDKAGAVKTTGKLADGTVLSLSGTLIIDGNEPACVFTVIYTSPVAYKGGCLFGIAEFAKHDNPADGDKIYLHPLDEALFIWENRNPQATPEHDKGFDRDIGLVGGWYDRVGNLYDYYQGKDLTVGADAGAPDPILNIGLNHYTSDWWDTSGIAISPILSKTDVMTGLTVVPKAGLPVNLGNNNWDYGAENTVGLKIGLTRATGIFKGSFKAWFDYDKTHTFRSILYEGVLTPERQDKEDGNEGRGFYLWADKAQYLKQGKTVTYPFNWSYDFLLQVNQ